MELLRQTVVTVTPNPAVDQMVWLGKLELGAVNRLIATQLDPAGKGINVARVIHRLGWPTVAYGLIAGETGAMLERLLEMEGVEHHFVRFDGRTRFNTTVVEEGERWTSLRGVGPWIAPAQVSEFEAMIESSLVHAAVLVLAGSLPPGVPQDFYARQVRAARRHGVKVLLDGAGEPLRLGVAERPDLIKPNLAEAEALLGRRLAAFWDVAHGARELSAMGIGGVVISLGAEGAVCARGERLWAVHPPRVQRRSTVGSGDSMVAGLAVTLAAGLALEEGLALAAAAGAATAMNPGTARGQADEIARLLPQVWLEPLELSDGLSAPTV